MAQLNLKLFGRFDVVVAGKGRNGGRNGGRFRSVNEQALLAYLAVENRQPHRRDKLAGLLWPEHPETAARRNLNQTLVNLRKAIGDYDADPPLLHITRQTLQLNTTGDIALDIHRFREQLRHAQEHDHTELSRCHTCASHLQTMMNLYRGPFLGDFSPADSLAFEEWQLFKREQFQIQALEALVNLARYYEWQGDWAQMLHVANRERELDPLREGAYRRLMQAAWQNGQRSQAIGYYEMCREILAAELGIEPEPATTAVYEQIKQGKERPAPAKAALPDTTVPDPTPYPLPIPATPLLGREQVLVELLQRLADIDYRLVTLVGQGGIGKTRLSLAVGEAALQHFPEGVCFVPLATVQAPAVDSEEVLAGVLAAAVANALNFTFSGSTDSAEQLSAFLRQKALLLILDNFEHLIAGAGFVERLLQHAPQLTILVTSRESLNLLAEYVVQLRGLPVPASTAEATQNASVRLFVERANRTRAGFQLNEDNLSAVTAICRLVDGNPLALELAAAWVRLMSPAEIAEAIQQTIDFLTTSLRHIPERHRSMRAVFNSSWTLLSAPEQQALAQLSIFQGGAKREAITAVTVANLPLLAALVDKSLLHWRSSGRYELHELVRQFAAEKLAERPPTEVDEIQEKYGRYYLHFAGRQAAALSGENVRQALVELRAEANNILRAWEWMVSRQDTAALKTGLPGLARFYLLTGQYQAGGEAVTLVLEKVTADDELRAELLVHQAAFLNGQGRYETAIIGCETAVVLVPSRPEITAVAHLYWGESLWYKGDLTAAHDRLRQALELAHQANLSATETHCLLTLGSVSLRQGENTEAQDYYEQALQLAQQLGDAIQESQAVRNLGAVSRNLGRYAQAQSYYEQSLRLARHIGDRQGEGAAHNNLGDLLLHQGIYTEAKNHFEQGLMTARLIGNRRGESIGLNNLGIVARDVGLYQEAQRYFEQSSTLSDEIGYKRGKGWTLICQSLLLAQTGDFTAARQHSFRALYLFETMEDKLGIGFASITYGRALEGLGYWQEAAQVYERTLAIREEMGQRHLLPESWAGLANVALQLGETAEALNQVEKILLFVADNPYLEGSYEPMRVYTISIRVLETMEDGRSQSLQETAVQLLQSRAQKIQDDRMRHAFLQNVPIHQQLLQMSK